jgi:hypothetical protein
MTIKKQNNRYTVTAKSGYGRITCSSKHLQHAMATVFNIVKGMQA